MASSKSRPDMPGAGADPCRLSFARRLLLSARVLILFLIFLATAGLYAAQRMDSVVDCRGLAQRIISKQTGMKVTVGYAKFSIARLALVLGDITALDKNKAILTVDKLTARIDLLETLKKMAPAFSRIDVAGPKANLVRMKDGSFNFHMLEHGGGGGQGADLAELTASALALAGNVKVADGDISWTDMKTAHKPVRERIHDFTIKIARTTPDTAGLYIYGWTGDPRHRSVCQAKGILGWRAPVGGGAPTASFTGRVKLDRLSMARFWPYIAPHVPFQRANALVSLDTAIKTNGAGRFISRGKLALSAIGIKYDQAFESTLKPGGIAITHDVSWERDALTVKNAELKMGGVTLRASGSVDKLETANPLFRLNLETDMIDVNELKRFVPYKILTDQQSAFITRNLEGGSIGLVDFSFDGDLATIISLDKPESYKSIAGQIRLADVTLGFDRLAYKFRKISGSAKLADGRLAFERLTGRYGASVLEEVTGALENLSGWPSFAIHMKAGLDMEEARRALSARVTAPRFREQIEKVKAMSGTVNLNLSVEGETGALPETLALAGDMVLDNVGMDSPALGLPLHEMNGTIGIGLRKMRVPRLTWKAGSSIFILKGSVTDILKPEPKFELSMVSKVNLEDMDKIKYLDFGAIYSQHGMAVLNTKLKGGFDEFQVSNRLDMTYAGFKFMDLVEKEPGFKNIYTFEGSVHIPGKVVIDRLLVDIGQSRIEMTGKVGRLLRGEDIDFTVSSKKARFDDLDKFLKSLEDIDSHGFGSGMFTIKKAGSGGPVKLKGHVRFDKADLKLPVFHEAFRSCDADFELLNNQIFLKNGNGVFGKGAFTMSGSAVLGDTNRFSLNVKSDALDLTDLFGPGEPESASAPGPSGRKDAELIAQPEDEDFFDGPWDIHVFSREGKIGPLVYQDLSTRIKYKNKIFHLEPFDFMAHGGKWSWIADISKAGSSIKFDSRIGIQDMDIENCLGNALRCEKILTGGLNMSGKMSGHGRRWPSIKENLNGEFQINTGKGVIRRFEALSRILSLLNISQYFKMKLPDLTAKGMPFDSITADFKVRAGVANTRNLVVNSEAMNISAIGDYNIATADVNMEVGVMPFITINRVVSSIPVVGHVLTGKNRSLITSYYSVKGPIWDPKVKSEPIESLAKGVVGILERLLTLPIKAYEVLKNGSRAGKPGAEETNSPENHQ